MSNSEPIAIVFQGIPRIRGLYNFRFEWRIIRPREACHDNREGQYKDSIPAGEERG